MAKKEGARKTGEAVVRCILPDYCYPTKDKTKPPVGYTITAKLHLSVRVVASVRLRGLPAFTMESRVPRVEGDEDGVGGGVRSTVNLGYCRPATHCKTVTAGKDYFIHHTSQFYMNCNGPEGTPNTIGKLFYIKVQSIEKNAPITDDDMRAAVKTLARMDRPGWWSQVSEEFENRVRAIATKLGTTPNNLMAVMSRETGGLFAADVVNSYGNTGLLQFSPSTAKALLKTKTAAEATAKLAGMTPEEQLDVVEKYLTGKGNLSDLDDLYKAVFAPGVAAGKPLLEEGDDGWEGNKSLDRDGDGVITKQEAAAPVRELLEEQQAIEAKKNKDGIKVSGPKPQPTAGVNSKK
jgi:hypothetical protein